ncbi:MAG: small ribosomal subunit Rsm22 family protein [Gaiellaceae bacterium]
MSALPPRLAEAIEELVAGVGGSVGAEVERLSTAYRGDGRSRAARTPAQVAAYLAYRAPATYAAAAAVFRQVAVQRPEWAPRSLLDAGAGPGVAAWAALEAWPSLDAVTLVEAEPEMVAAGRELLPDRTWIQGDVRDARGPADLVLASYVLGELADVAGTALHLWEQAADTVALVEPGTPAGYRRILEARAAVIETGGFTVAPCPHDLPCPLPADDWCHFAVRLPRSKLHRRVKGAELGYEDEKLSYAVLSREPVPKAASRVIRRPQVRSGYVEVVTSDADGHVREHRVAKSAGTVYRQARKASWGDALPRPDSRRCQARV